MTTFIEFVPTVTGPFQFQATLDNEVYTVIATWGLFGKRYYINVYTLAGVLVIATAMVGSPPDYDINLVGGLFTSTLIWRVQNNQFEISP